MNKRKNIVSLGAGTGQAAIVGGLIGLPDTHVTALVTTTDNGGSSAMIRASLDIPSPGDVRNVINAINPHQDILSQLLNYRFSDGELTGTHLGNLIVGALSRICGSYEAGISYLNTLLELPAHVLPISNHPAEICAELLDGTLLQGEWQIIKRSQQHIGIKRYFLSHPQPAGDDGIQAIREADKLIICPGVLGTGIISTLLFDGVKEAIQASGAPVIYIANVMTYPSQTNGFTLSDHLHMLEEYLGVAVQTVLINTTLPPRHILVQYAQTGAYPIPIDYEQLAGYQLIEADLLIDYTSSPQVNELVRASGTQQHVGAHLIRHESKKVQNVLVEHNLIS